MSRRRGWRHSLRFQGRQHSLSNINGQRFHIHRRSRLGCRRRCLQGALLFQDLSHNGLHVHRGRWLGCGRRRFRAALLLQYAQDHGLHVDGRGYRRSRSGFQSLNGITLGTTYGDGDHCYYNWNDMVYRFTHFKRLTGTEKGADFHNTRFFSGLHWGGQRLPEDSPIASKCN